MFFHTERELLHFILGSVISLILYLIGNWIIERETEAPEKAKVKDLQPELKPDIDQIRRENEELRRLNHALVSAINQIPYKVEDAARRGALTGSIAGTRAAKRKLKPERLQQFRMGVVRIAGVYNEMIKINPVEEIQRPKN